MHEQDVSHWNRFLNIQDRRERRAEKALHYRSYLRVSSFMDGDYSGEVYHLLRKADIASRQRGPIMPEPYSALLLHWLYVHLHPTVWRRLIL